MRKPSALVVGATGSDLPILRVTTLPAEVKIPPRKSRLLSGFSGGMALARRVGGGQIHPTLGERSTVDGGEEGIRTPGTLLPFGFQDRRDRPLCHLSGGKFTELKVGSGGTRHRRITQAISPGKTEKLEEPAGASCSDLRFHLTPWCRRPLNYTYELLSTEFCGNFSIFAADRIR